MDWLRETQWLLWVAAALVAGLLEILSLDLVFGMVVGGALAAGLGASLGLSFTWQVVVFALITGLLLVGVRPPMKRWAEARSPYVPTNADALVGREVEVLETVSDRGGLVKLAGETWTARIAPGAQLLETGSPAYVLRIDGATAVVVPQPPRPPGLDAAPGREPA